MNNIKGYLNRNRELIAVIITCMALADNIWMLILKIALESVVLATLWVIVLVMDYIKERKNKDI